jgi:hypothetical protein
VTSVEFHDTLLFESNADRCSHFVNLEPVQARRNAKQCGKLQTLQVYMDVGDRKFSLREALPFQHIRFPLSQTQGWDPNDLKVFTH